MLPLQRGDLAHESVAIGPAFVGVGQVAKGRTRQQVGGPEQEVQEFLGLGLHGGSVTSRRRKGNATFGCICDERLPQEHSFSAVYIHLVLSTKDRRPLLRDKPTHDALHSYLGVSDFKWQGGYVDFSVSQSNLEPVKQYIAGLRFNQILPTRME